MELNGLKIIVVGAGIGGLASALALHAKGADVTVLEQAEAITEVGAGLQISPNGVAVLRALGLSDQLFATGLRARAVSLRDYRRPGEVMRLDLARHAADLDYILLHRADLIDLLAAAVRQKGIQIRLLQQLEKVEFSPHPVLHMANGSRVTADLIVGADGLHSRLRAALNGEDSPFFTGQVAWRATVSNSFGHPGEARVFMGPGRHLVTYPLRGGALVNLVAVQERVGWAAEGWSHKDDPENLRSAFADFLGDAKKALDQVDDVGIWGLFRHPVAALWYGERAALVGDAAHPTLPFLAQGGNMALEDAWVLADALAGGADLQSGLHQYQSRRRDRAVRVIEAANGNAWKYHLRFPPLRGTAHLGLRMLSTFAPHRMVQQFDWLYRHDVTQTG